MAVSIFPPGAFRVSGDRSGEFSGEFMGRDEERSRVCVWTRGRALLEVAEDARVPERRGFLCARGAVGGTLLTDPTPLPLPCPLPLGLPLVGACTCWATWCV